MVCDGTVITIVLMLATLCVGDLHLTTKVITVLTIQKVVLDLTVQDLMQATEFTVVILPLVLTEMHELRFILDKVINMAQIQRLRKEIARKYLPDIKKFASHHDALVQGFALTLEQKAEKLFAGEITLENFKDRQYINPLEAETEDSKLARTSLNYMKDRIAEFWVDGYITAETA
jgi:hypothetical protein